MHKLAAFLLALSFATTTAATERIVSLGAGVTETLYAVGAGDRIVGVDSSSRWPLRAQKLPQVGYHRTLGAEGILALNPTRVLGTTQAGPPEALEKIRSAKVPVTLLPEATSLESALSLMQSVADDAGKSDEGRALIASIRKQLERLRDQLPTGERPRVLMVLSAHGGSPLAAGRDTAADLMIALAGGINAGNEFTGFKPLSAEAVIKLAPQVIAVPDHALPMLGGRDAVLKLPGFADTPAGREQRLVVMDSLLLLGLGPRLADAATELALAIHARKTASAE